MGQMFASGEDMPLRPALSVDATAATAASSLPLIVDIDHLLVRADVAAEIAIAEVEARLSRLLKALRGEAVGVSAREVAAFVRQGIDVSTIPLDEDMVAFLADCHDEGRSLHAVSRLAQPVVDALAARLGFFDSATGGLANDEQKLASVAERFPRGYTVTGRLWHSPPNGGLRIWLSALRLHQWSKNALVFVPLLLGHAYGDVSAVLSCVAGFVLIGLVASGTYLINDLVDLTADRAHPTKRFRALARGDIRAGAALVVAGVASAGSLLAAACLSLVFLATLVGYLALTLAYSFCFKRLLLVDVFVLATLFTSRIAMGIALAGVPPSSWLLTFTMFFFLSLSLAKRHTEIVSMAAQGTMRLSGRDYIASDSPLTVSLGVAANAVAMLVMCLYLTNDAMPAQFYRAPYWLWGAAFVVFLWSLRIWGLAHRGKLDADPVAFAVTDRFSIALGVIVAAVFVLAI
jgi:4-hydroxybenzoate polyprenyltransferase